MSIVIIKQYVSQMRVCNHNIRSINYYFYFDLLLLIIEKDYDDYYSHLW